MAYFTPGKTEMKNIYFHKSHLGTIQWILQTFYDEGYETLLAWLAQQNNYTLSAQNVKLKTTINVFTHSIYQVEDKVVIS